ncbi:MAG: hypothetical protein R3337_00100 [Gammaproteobacteria bacterium]|nr:hypothetical protein [Gammaproteobacteria bacterium]
MAFVAADWTIALNGDIRYIGDDHGGASPSYCTVLELHRALQDFADDATPTGDDLLSIAENNPSDKSTANIVTLLNGYNIDDGAAEHIYDGSIVQADGDTIYDGIVNYGNATNIIVHQNGAVLSDDWWNSGGGLNADATQGISHRFMVKVRDGGSDIDGRRLLGLYREFGTTYSEFAIAGTNRGNNVLALSGNNDLNNQTAVGTVATWSDITNTEGYQTIDLSNGNGAQPYYSQWDRASRTINQLYERTKWITRRGTGETIYGLAGELFRGPTHQIPVDTPSGTFTEPEAVSWSGGTGQLLAIDSTTAPTVMWIQLLTGVAPTDGQTITGGTSGATCDVNGSATTRNVSPAFLGQSTGSAIIGAYGVGVEAADLTVADQLTDLTNTLQQPPNNQSFSVSGLVSGEDRVLVGPLNGTSDGIEYDQLTANGAQSAGAGTLVVNEAIPADTPASGTVRVFTADGFYDRVPYSSWSGSTFTLSGTLPANVADAANVFISYIDTLAGSSAESFSYLYSSDRSLWVRVRDGGGTPIEPFETLATAGAAGGSVTAIRNSDV